jgi:hypothetical protein
MKQMSLIGPDCFLLETYTARFLSGLGGASKWCPVMRSMFSLVNGRDNSNWRIAWNKVLLANWGELLLVSSWTGAVFVEGLLSAST